ncbi:MAG: aldehyde dehydrogenase family protein, partial [Terriglobia bacterium]
MAVTSIEKKEYPMLIAGEWVRTSALRTITLPYDGTPVGDVYDADAAIAERAVTAACAGAEAVAKLTQYERAELLERMRHLLE